MQNWGAVKVGGRCCARLGILVLPSASKQLANEHHLMCTHFTTVLKLSSCVAVEKRD